MIMPWPGDNGFGPRMKVRRRPFFKSTVVKVAVETCSSAARNSGVRLIGYSVQEENRT